MDTAMSWNSKKGYEVPVRKIKNSILHLKKVWGEEDLVTEGTLRRRKLFPCCKNSLRREHILHTRE